MPPNVTSSATASSATGATRQDFTVLLGSVADGTDRLGPARKLALMGRPSHCESQVLKSVISDALRASGFERNGSCFFVAGAELVSLVGLRKATHGGSFHLDGGIHLRSLSFDLAPRVNDWHVQFNLNILAGEGLPALVKALEIGPADRADFIELAVTLRERCVPGLLDLSASLAALRTSYRRGALNDTLILRDARRVLDSE